MIGPYVKFIEVSEEELITVISQNLTSDFPGKRPDEFFYHTKPSYSFPKKYIEFIYCQPIWKDYNNEKSENINNIGCLMSFDHSVIENKCIVLANKYDLDSASFYYNRFYNERRCIANHTSKIFFYGSSHQR